ncbi:MAG: DNA cytosine methyltransferase [Methyloligellaceae bacterium]
MGQNGEAINGSIAGRLSSPTQLGPNTMLATPGKLPPLLIRRLTPIECERLQGFPDGWTVPDTER